MKLSFASRVGWSVALVVLVCQAALAEQREAIVLEGLEQPVEILKDRWGISHIYAETEHDLFFAQGYNAARDRLFQLEIWRRQATGTVAEILGPREIPRDHGARLFQLRVDMEQEMRHYHPRGDRIIPAFVAGINAYIDRTREEPDLLPLEFELLDIDLSTGRPRWWSRGTRGCWATRAISFRSAGRSTCSGLSG